MDFFDQHEYTFELNEMNQEAQFDGPSKPLIFSEWGGKSVGQAQPIMGQSVDRLIDLVESGSLSGHMFWSWQDLRQYSRVDGEVHEGVLETGAVTESRDHRASVWNELARLFAGRRTISQRSPDDNRVTVLPLRRSPFGAGNKFSTVDLKPLVDSHAGKQSWAVLQAALDTYWKNRFGEDQGKQTGAQFQFWQNPEVKIGGVSFSCPVVDNHVRPIVLTQEFPEVLIPINQSCIQLHILGQVSYPNGYPLVGQAGDQAATYTLQYGGGQKQSFPIRHGIELAQSNCVEGASRITPIAIAAQPAIQFVKDPAREHYQILLLSIPTQTQELTTLRCQLNPSQPAIAIFAITSEQK